MAQQQMQSEMVIDTRRLRLPDGAEAMLALLGRSRPQSDSEAFAVLRRSFPASPLCERVAAVGLWRMG